MTSSPKKPKSKTYLFLKIGTRRHSGSLEGLNSSLAQVAGELWPGRRGRHKILNI